MDTSDQSMEEHELHYNTLASLIKTSEKKIRYFETRAAQLAVADLIIQCILYIQSSTAAATLRGKWWIPFCLSASVSIAFFLTFASAVRDCLTVKRQQDAVFVEQDGLYREMHLIRYGLQIKDHDPASSTATGVTSGRRRLAEAFKYARCKRYAYAGFLSTALLFFNLLVLYAICFLSKQN